MKEFKKEEIHNIFQRIKQGEKQAVEELYVKYKNLIINISYSIVKDKNIAEEIAQMVFLKILQSSYEKLPNSNEFSWLYIVTKNQTIDYIKKQRNDIELDDIYDIPDKNNSIDKIIDIDIFNNMIAGLDKKDKEIISLKVIADFTFKEIGLMLNMPMATVQWKYYKSIHTLKLLLSNLTMFIISLLLYINQKDKSEERQEKITSKDTNNTNSYSSHNNFEPSSLDGFTGQSKISTTQSREFELGLFSISAIFLLLTITFGIIFIKHQQKRHYKSSK